MLAFWVTMGILSYWFVRARGQQRLAAIRRNQFRLYALRDELRELAMSGEVSADDWVFRYLDTSLTRAVSELHRLNLSYVIVAAVLYRGDQRLNDVRKQLEVELCSRENALLVRIHGEYLGVLLNALFERNPLARLFLLHLPVRAIGWTRRVSSAVEYWTEIPSTATLERMAPCPLN